MNKKMLSLKKRLINDEVKYILTTLADCERKGHYYYIHREISPEIVKMLQAIGLFVHCEKNKYTYVCLRSKKTIAVKQMNPYPAKKKK